MPERPWLAFLGCGQGRVKGEAVLWLRETLGLVNSSLKACATFSGFKHHSLPLPSPPPQLNCFLTGSVWDWGYQSGLLRLGGSLPALFIQNYVYTLSQTFWVSLYGISLIILHLGQGTPHWCDTVFSTCNVYSDTYSCQHLFLVFFFFFLNTVHHFRMRANDVFFMKPLISVFIHCFQ